MLDVITEQNKAIFERLAQDYEDEFSPITGKIPDEKGKYSIDVDWHAPSIGYYWKEGNAVVGFCIMKPIEEYNDIAEFYVVPSYRKKGIGKKLAFAVFNRHRGLWQVRQILLATDANKFWKRVVSSYTLGKYTEMEMEDPTWGKVICQRFTN